MRILRRAGKATAPGVVSRDPPCAGGAAAVYARGCALSYTSMS